MGNVVFAKLIDSADNDISGGIKALGIASAEERLVTGALTADGVQTSTEITSGGAGTWTDVLVVGIEPRATGLLRVLDMVLVADFMQLNTTTTLTWQWQARNKGGTWVDLHSAVLESANTITTWTTRTRQGLAAIVSNLNSVPFDVRLRFQTSEAGQGRARVRSASVIRFRYEAY